jgi:hypothetical protein
MLWVAAGGSHDTSFPARSWAELFDLDDPEGNGERRIRDAIAWLERNEFVRVERDPGRPPSVFLLNDDGSGGKYSVPASNKKKRKLAHRHWYVTLPATFWATGWGATLSAPALAVLLALLHWSHGGEGSDFWISPSQARKTYEVSADTWTRGVAELRHHRLVTVKRAPVGRDFSWRRLRNTYTVHLERLGKSPNWIS